MKTTTAVWAIALMFPAISHAGQVYGGELFAEYPAGATAQRFRVSIDIEFQGNQFKGEVMSPDSRRCRGPAAIEGTVDGDSISFRSEILPVQGCGRINFKGKKVGDAFQGTIPWDGKDRPITFKKQGS
jgi:hypothetical protein